MRDERQVEILCLGCNFEQFLQTATSTSIGLFGVLGGVGLGIMAIGNG